MSVKCCTFFLLYDLIQFYEIVNPHEDHLYADLNYSIDEDKSMQSYAIVQTSENS